MFVSTDFLAIHYGVDDKIAKFFVDRDPPTNNLYWKDKLLYLRFEPGYLFIPLIVDLIYKLGVPREQLLSMDFIELMETTGHISALEEVGKYSAEEAIDACIKAAAPKCQDDDFLQSLHALLKKEEGVYAKHLTDFKALHRGDLFLFSVCALQADAATYEKIVRYWFALITSLLLLDDAEDVTIDRQNNEPNAFIQSGMDEEGVARLKALVKRNLQLIATINKPMALKLDKQLVDMFNKPNFQRLLNLN